MASSRGTGMIGAGSAALRKVMTGSLGRKGSPASQIHLQKLALENDSISSVIEGEIIPRLLMAHMFGPGRDST